MLPFTPHWLAPHVLCRAPVPVRKRLRIMLIDGRASDRRPAGVHERACLDCLSFASLCQLGVTRNVHRKCCVF